MNQALPTAYLPETGERMLPLTSAAITFWEHICRYRFASQMVANEDVLDIACGEGYGSAAMVSSGAKSVISIDIAEEAVAHAKSQYGLDARVGRAESIPVENQSIDTVVSFETIEHVSNPEHFLTECRRILRSNGKLVISTPNVGIYTKDTPDNPFHCSEMSFTDFKALLNKHFHEVSFYGQCFNPWFLRKRGFRKLCRLIRKFFDPEHEMDLDQNLRSNSVKLCCLRPPGFTAFLTYEAVRSLSDSRLNECVYIVAVARLPKV